MAAPRLTRAQLRPVVERAFARVGDGRRPVVLVHADPDSVPELGPVQGHDVVVRGSRSPLEIRRLLREAADAGAALVIVTDVDAAQLGDDVLVRTPRRRLERVDRWATVCQLFGAERPSAELARRPHLADALIEAAPLAGYPKVTTRVLDLDTATAALLRTSIGIPDDASDLAAFLRWVERPEAAGRIATARGELLRDLEPALRARFGPGVDSVLAVVRGPWASDVVPLGVVAAAVHAPASTDVVAAARLDERLGGLGCDPAACRAWGAAAEAVVTGADDPGRAAGWLERAGALLHDLGAEALAEHSDLLPAGFDLRIRRAAAALDRWQASPGDGALATEAHRAIERAAAHAARRHAPERVERLRMAARLVRRGSLSLTGLDDLASAAAAYERDGAWLDAARTVVSRGDPDPVADGLYRALTAAADAAREADGLRFAQLASAAATSTAPHLGVEEVLDRVVVPLAAVRPVLLVVLDGLGWPTFTELVGAVEGAGWMSWRRPGDAGQLAVAALPTVTEVSRTSLLAGRLRTGDDGSERRAFAAHPGLLTVTGSGPEPLLFHKRHLRVGGLDTQPQELLDAVADSRRRVVGVVLNNIDERLKDVARPAGRWELRDLDPLRLVLEEARRAGRAVVLTADHGHVLDRDAAMGGPSSAGERWRHAEPPAGDGELLVQGPRVVTDDHRAVLPWREQLRYGPRRNGYHGGLTPRELFVPLVVFSTEDLPEESGWRPAGFRPPAWWHHMQLRPALTGATVPAPAVSAAAAPSPAPEQAVAPTLFDEPPEPIAPPEPVARAAEPAWVEALLASPLLAARRANPRIRVGDDELRRLLSVLDAAGSMAVGMQRLAQEADLPAARIHRYVAQLQELLNVDGYGVLTTLGDEVRLDRALLDRQFGL